MFVCYKNVNIYYTRKGSGEVLLLLHGWGGSTQSLMMFENELLFERSVINVDFPPFGKSGKLLSEWTVDDYANCVKLILQKESVSTCDIICHSFGGRVALILASENRVGKLVLISSAGIRVNRFKTFLSVKWYKMKKLLVKLKLISKRHIENKGSDDFINASDSMKKTFINIINYDSRHLLKHINCQTLLLWGRQDDATPLKIAKVLRRKIKNSELILFDGGHFVYIEQVSKFITIIKYFLLRSKWWNFLLKLMHIFILQF